MTSALIADDEPHLAAYLREQLVKPWPELEIVPVVRSGVDAAEQIGRLRPDLAFFDIKLPGLTGIEVAQVIEVPTQVVFVTAYDEFALRAFEQDALDYVLNPVKAERLAQTIARILRALATPPEPDDVRLAAVLARLLTVTVRTTPLRWVRASQGELTHQIDVAEVLFFRADDKYTCVQTADGEHLIRTPIAELAAQLDAAQFWQVHRSTLVNLQFVAGTRGDELSRLFVRLRGRDGELPVSRAYVHLFKAM
jgi:DNA-binding LytR/AlgR family response regulator